MKVFNNYHDYDKTDLLSFSWEVEDREAIYCEDGNYTRKVREMRSNLTIIYNQQRINLHTHHEDTDLVSYETKMKMLGELIMAYVEADPSKGAGDRIWLNHGKTYSFMLGSASYCIDPKDDYFCITIADCQRRIFMYDRTEKKLKFLRELAAATTSIVKAINWIAERREAGRGQVPVE